MSKKDNWDISFKTIKISLLLIIIFYSIAFWRYSATGKIFFIYNFVYIGTALALGGFLNDALPKKHILWGRGISQFLIGIYMLGYLGFILHENMQIEGFFFYLFAGVFAAATLHYFIAKIVGPIIFNRGWCGWACLTGILLLVYSRYPGQPTDRLLLVCYRKSYLLSHCHYFSICP